MRTFTIATLVFAALAIPTAAHAGNNAAAAQALFEEARALIAAGNYAAGCAKLEGSQALDPGPGTQYNLALCYEKSGRTASAWATYLEAAAAYKATSRPEWEAKARDRASVLAPTLSKLRIVVAPGAPSDLAITRDGVAVVASELGTAIPVDPGTHVIEAKASGRPAFRASSVIAAGQSKQVDVVLGSAAAAPASATAPVPSAPSHTVAYVVGGVGIAGLAFGAVAGLVALNKNASSTDVCPNDGACADAGARSDSRAAGSWATVSTIGFIAGGALLAAGAVLYVVAPGSTSGSTATAKVGIGPAGVTGTW
jgi:hypothetical protein